MPKGHHLSHFYNGGRRGNVNADGEPVVETPAEFLEFEAIFLAQYSRVVRVIARIVNDSGWAEDVAMEVFGKLWRTPPRKISDVGGWLYRTAVRAALDELRRRARREKYEHLFSSMRPLAREEQAHSTDEARQVRHVLSSMKKRDAELLVLRSEGMSYEEIAQVLVLNPVSIGTLLNRAQLAFRKEYIRSYGKR